MNMTKTFFHIKDGKLTNPKVVKGAFPTADGMYEMVITRKNRRSQNQNAYYWGVVVRAVKDGLVDLGHDVTIEETHDFLKGRFNARELVNESTGEVLSLPQSTSEMNKEEFGIYIDKIQQFAAEFLNITIPSAGKQTLINY